MNSSVTWPSGKRETLRPLYDYHRIAVAIYGNAMINKNNHDEIAEALRDIERRIKDRQEIKITVEGRNGFSQS